MADINPNDIMSRQYRLSRGDWETELLIMEGHRRFYEQAGVGHQYEELMVDGNPVHHLDTGPKKVRCLRRQNKLWLEGVHWRGHCPALIYGKEIEVMAKNSTSTKTQSEKRKSEVKTAQLAPGKHVMDPVETKTKRQKKSEPRPCSCQCGQITGGGYFFPGHDAKLKSLFTKVRDGKIKKNMLHATVAKMYTIWDQDKSKPVKEIAKQVCG